jgi:hypothetical protein
MLNIVENDLAGAEQNSSLPSLPSCNKVRCPEPSTTQTRLEDTAAKPLAEAPSASAKPPPLAQLKSRSKEEIDWAGVSPGPGSVLEICSILPFLLAGETVAEPCLHV